MTWHVRAVGLPYGEDPGDWWIDESGEMHDEPIADADDLPGEFVLPGLADAHAHPAIGADGVTPLAWAKQQTADWGDIGVCLIRDVGSPGGVTLDITPTAGSPLYVSAGRFLAPAGRYFPELLVEPVEVEELTAAAVAEVDKGATWVKVIADFPNFEAGTGPEPNYPLDVIAAMIEAVHAKGARVAAHCTIDNVDALVAAGIDSIEHGSGLTEDVISDMAARGTAWTPTLSAMTALRDSPDTPAAIRDRIRESCERLGDLLPTAVMLGVPVLAGTDTYGPISKEVALLAELGLTPTQALAAASVWPRQYLGVTGRADIVTYAHDPREDPSQLDNPTAVVVDGVRRR
ncbi:MAG: amidohydrolase family protein [Frankiaceae bacterium]|nr:amidohydrolase family protein [Frankiaceae bacterium]